MTKQYDNSNRGALFVNDRKEQDSHPDLKGSINVGGKEYWLSAWNRDTAKGPVISISVQPKDAPHQTAAKAGAAKREAQRPAQRAPEPDFNDDDLPF
jgi:hypothetical protein